MNKPKSDKELTPQQYHVLRENGTEPPFSGKYVDHSENGMYHCASCGNPLFASKNKFESKTLGLQGWPSFTEAASNGSVILQDDNSMGMHRKEVLCAKCGGHLGHVFEEADDQPEGKHFCINSCALEFEKKNEGAKAT